jgi:hypothetical protein
MRRTDYAARGFFGAIVACFVGLGIEVEYAAIVLPNVVLLVALVLVLRAPAETVG